MSEAIHVLPGQTFTLSVHTFDGTASPIVPAAVDSGYANVNGNTGCPGFVFLRDGIDETSDWTITPLASGAAQQDWSGQGYAANRYDFELQYVGLQTSGIWNLVAIVEVNGYEGGITRADVELGYSAAVPADKDSQNRPAVNATMKDAGGQPIAPSDNAAGATALPAIAGRGDVLDGHDLIFRRIPAAGFTLTLTHDAGGAPAYAGSWTADGGYNERGEWKKGTKYAYWNGSGWQLNATLGGLAINQPISSNGVNFGDGFGSTWTASPGLGTIAVISEVAALDPSAQPAGTKAILDAAIAAILAAIKAKTDTLGSGTVAVASPVGSDGSMVIYRNNDHKAADGRSFDFVDPGTWPDLTGATSLTVSVRKVGVNSDPAPLILTGSRLAGPPQVARFESTKTQTVALAPSVNAGDYIFDLVAVLADGNTVTLIPEGSATVVCNVTGTGLPAGSPSPVALNAGSQW